MFAHKVSRDMGQSYCALKAKYPLGKAMAVPFWAFGADWQFSFYPSGHDSGFAWWLAPFFFFTVFPLTLAAQSDSTLFQTHIFHFMCVTKDSVERGWAFSMFHLINVIQF